jgi:16S rRNA (adenine1518-N6/adenine1519-N6)-dimethyltransferase
METKDVVRPSELKELLYRHGFSFKKQFGQNFLIDERVLSRIVEAAELTARDGAFEIGPGAGVVTRRLARNAKQVVTVEKDRTLAPVLEDSLKGMENVKVVFEDVLETDLEQLWENFSDCDKVSVVANLPYYITTPILFHLLDSDIRLANIVVMVQKEVADRMMAEPGTKDYGALSVAVQYRAEVDKVVQVSPGCFLPPPNVESTVVRLRIRSEPPVKVDNEKLFSEVVRAAFGMRRKTLLNALSAGLSLAKKDCEQMFETLQILPNRRGETLRLEEFAAVANYLHKRMAP